jgi:hypothetical protein
MIVSACIIGGSVYSGLAKLAEAVGNLDKQADDQRQSPKNAKSQLANYLE